MELGCSLRKVTSQARAKLGGWRHRC